MTKVLDKPLLDRPSPSIEGINMASLTEKWCVEAYNNDISTFQDVMSVLMDVCKYDKNTALMYTNQIHRTGKAVCYWNSQEKCEGVISAFGKIGVKAILREV